MNIFHFSDLGWFWFISRVILYSAKYDIYSGISVILCCNCSVDVKCNYETFKGITYITTPTLPCAAELSVP